MGYDEGVTQKNGKAALLYQLELGLAINSKHKIRYEKKV